VEHLKKALALPANTKLGWKGLSGTNTLAYYRQQNTAVISFMIKAAGLTLAAVWMLVNN
jgi:hypothetical protein